MKRPPSLWLSLQAQEYWKPQRPKGLCQNTLDTHQKELHQQGWKNQLSSLPKCWPQSKLQWSFWKSWECSVGVALSNWSCLDKNTETKVPSAGWWAAEGGGSSSFGLSSFTEPSSQFSVSLAPPPSYSCYSLNGHVAPRFPYCKPTSKRMVLEGGVLEKLISYEGSAFVKGLSTLMGDPREPSRVLPFDAARNRPTAL